MKISTSIISWYKDHKRDLPWRDTTDPYQIWLSEIILQQTRVAQGLPYFLKFVEHFPTIRQLAEASEEEVLTLWQGLGYYSRARNMHYTAMYVSNQLNGKFPETYSKILKLKGVGEYTAAAISSFAFGLPYPVLDGNVYRVLARLFGIEAPIDKPHGQRIFKETLNSIFDDKNPALWNQAVMEFGAMMCTPKKPNCKECPVSQHCEALKNDKVYKLPYKEGKTKVIEVVHTYLVLNYENKTYIEKRTEGTWKNLYQFPLAEQFLNKKGLKEWAKKLIINELCFEFGETYQTTHLLSHRKINANFCTLYLDTKPIFSKRDIFEIDLSELGKKYPISTLIKKFLNSKQ